MVLCDKCGAKLQIGDYPFCSGDSTKHTQVKEYAIIGDELPVGYAARHGVCHPDGTPRKFDTMTELKRALNEKGYKISGDTPGKPYKVNWSGRRTNAKEAE